MVVLAAGAGTRLRPLTALRPKPLCPVGDRALLDWSLGAVAPLGLDVAVNVHHGAGRIVAHIEAMARSVVAHVSHERDRALGTAGAIGHLRGWLDGRGALVVNADTWHRADLGEFVSGWDGERVRLLTSSPLPFGPGSGVVASIVPWAAAENLTAEPTGLWEVLWRAELAVGRLDAVRHHGVVVDCGTPGDYLAANLTWSGGESVIGAGATVDGSVTRCVVWPGSVVTAGEVLVDAIRADGLTVLVR